MTASPTWLECSGCGFRLADGRPAVLRCPAAVAGDDIDHVIVRRVEPGAVAFAGDPEPNPFVGYRRLFHAYHQAREVGWDDAAYVALVERFDRAVEEVDGRGFRATPFVREPQLSDRLGFAAGGGVLVKDETRNVSGSHKARHLMGTLLELEVASANTPAPETAAGELPPLAIASCGNAALAAAVVARAAGRALEVFIPAHADAVVVERLRELGARLTVCERAPGTEGDPTYLRLLDALERGAVPFTCQGNLNGLAIEGGETLAWEIVTALLADRRRLDRLFVQVGGGALASSCVRAFRDARIAGADLAMPRFHAVQAQGVHPLVRAHERVAELAEQTSPEEALRFAAAHRSAFMWPWEREPFSVAGGILDDETYDWRAVVEGMLTSDGGPIVVEEADLLEANELARSTTGIDVDHTGSAGLAGLLKFVHESTIDPDETVAVLFTGERRGPQPPTN